MGGSSAKYGGAISQVWGGVINQLWGGHQPTMGGPISQVWGGGVSIFPPVCTGSQNPQNYFSNTYVLPSVNRTAGPIKYEAFSLQPVLFMVFRHAEFGYCKIWFMKETFSQSIFSRCHVS